jgi:chloride channel protein, CIC family
MLIKKEKLQSIWNDFSSRENSFNLLLAMIIGLIGGYGAVGFHHLISWVELTCFQSSEPTVHWLLDLPWWQRLLIPALGGLLVGPIVSRFASEAKGHGVPEVMAAVARKGGLIKGRVAMAKVVASALTIGTGGSAGAEGPIVQIGSAISSKISQLLHLNARRMKTFVGCGAAAGIAATFNAPVAGMLFAVEVILGDFGVASLSPIIVASVVATAISRGYLGDSPAFAVPDYEMVSALELVPYALLGVAAAFVAVAFSWTLDKAESYAEQSKVPDWIKPAIGGLGLGALGAAGLPHVFGGGYEFIEEALRGNLPLMLLAGLIVAKIIATSLTLGSGGSGGILAPSLFLGAMLGGVVWYGAHYIGPTLTPANYGAYSLVGMAAVLAAATRAPLQSVLILFELTGGYQVILPLMFSSILAVMVASRLSEESIYTIKLKAKGIDLKQGRDANILSALTVAEIMRPDMQTVPSDQPVSQLLQDLSGATQHPTFFMLDADGKLAGFIAYPEIRRILFDVENLAPILRAEDIADVNLPGITPATSLDLLSRHFARLNSDELPVVDPKDPRRLLGSVHRGDIVDAYHAAVLKDDLLGGMQQSISAAHHVGHAQLAPGISMCEVECPSHWAGKSLLDLNLRQRKGLDVLLIKRHEGESTHSIAPTAEFVLQAGDVLLLSGSNEKLAQLIQA